MDHYRLLSAPVDVRFTEPAFAEALRWHLAPFFTGRRGRMPVTVDVYKLEDLDDGARYQYARNGRPGFAGSLGGVLNYALWDMNAFITRWARDWLFLHAGGATRGGRAVLLPASRDSGKSTLTAALLEAGFEYLSDELAAIDPVTGHVHPFPKRISLDGSALRFFAGLEGRLDDRRGLSSGLRQRYVRPEDLSSAVGRPGPAGWLVFPSLDRDGAPRLSPLSPADAVERMAANCFNLYRYRDRGVVLLARLAREAKAYRLDGGTPRERADLLADALS